MATAEEYGKWIVANQDKIGTPEFNTIAQAYQLARNQQPAPATAQSSPTKYDPTDGMSFGEKALAGTGKAFSDLYRGTKQLLNIGDQKALQSEIDEAKRLDAPLMNTGAGIAGNIVGSAAAALPTMLIPGANTVVGGALVGGALGALTPTATGESALGNVGVGAAGGALGNVAAKVIGRLSNPVQSQLSPELQGLVQKAEQYGIPLDAADRTGSRPLKVIRSVMESLPLTADKQAALNEAKRQAFNRAVLQNIGESADKASPEVLNAARQRIGGEFNRLTSSKQIPIGQDFLDTLANIDAGVTPFSSPSIRSSVDKGLDVAQQSPLTGEAYQKIRSTLGTTAKDAFNSSNSETGQALKSIQTALDKEAEKALTGPDLSAWRDARHQWQALKVLEKAAAPNSADAVAGNISPAKLSQALMSSDRNGMIYGTRGDNMGDLARIGQALVKEQIPNSGTPERTFWQNMLTGNPLDALYKGAVGGVSVPVQAMINSKPGQAYLSHGLVPLNNQTELLAKLLLQGATGAGTGAALLPPE